jgi:hypothetical protein
LTIFMNISVSHFTIEPEVCDWLKRVPPTAWLELPLEWLQVAVNQMDPIYVQWFQVSPAVIIFFKKIWCYLHKLGDYCVQALELQSQAFFGKNLDPPPPPGGGRVGRGLSTARIPPKESTKAHMPGRARILTILIQTMKNRNSCLPRWVLPPGEG